MITCWSCDCHVINMLQEGSGTTKKFLCGAMAGIAAKTVTLPFDLVKKRLQVSWNVPENGSTH